MAEERGKIDADEKPVFSWTAPEFYNYAKPSGWFAVVSLIAVVLIALFAWQRNWTAIGVVVATFVAFVAQAKAKPKNLKCSLFRSGAVIDERVYQFDTLKSFSIVVGEHSFARLSQTRRWSQDIHLPIAEEDPEQVRLFLSKFLPEDEKAGEDIADRIQRWIRF